MGPLGFRNQYCPEIIDVSTSGSGYDQFKYTAEEFITVIVLQRLFRIDAGVSGAPQNIRRNKTTGIVSAAVDTVGIAGDRMDRRVPVKCDCECQSVFTVAPTAAVTANVHSGFATGENDAGRCNRPATRRYLQCEFRVFLGEFARITAEVAKHIRAYFALDRERRARDYRIVATREYAHLTGRNNHGLAVLNRLAGAVRNGDGKSFEYIERLGCRTGIRYGWPGCDHRNIVTRNIRNYQSNNPGGRTGRSQLAALDGRQLFAHTVDLVDRCAGTQQLRCNVLFLAERYTIDGQAQQG